MERCLACGAELRPDMDWCARCFAPRGSVPVDPAALGHDAPAIGRAPVEIPVVRYSRVQAGPTSMGWVPRMLATVAVLAVAVLLWFYGFPNFLGATGFKKVAFYAILVVPGGVFLLSRIWKRARVA